jgi:large subunit ribosomal protein L29
MVEERVQALRELPDEDLRQKVAALRKELFTLRVHQVSGRVERPSQFRTIRRQLARVLTVLREQEITRTRPPAPGAGGNSGKRSS